MMSRSGATVERPGPGVIRIPASRYDPLSIRIGGDWSSAAFVLAASFVSGRPVVLTGLDHHSAQGDRVFPAWLDALGRAGPRSFDATMTPDLVPPLVACALFAGGRTEIVGGSHLRAKESDRIAVLEGELGLTGAGIRSAGDGLVIDAPPCGSACVTLDPRGDHRMAMTFGIVGLRVPGIAVKDPACVSKSFPGFWPMLGSFRAGPCRCRYPLVLIGPRCAGKSTAGRRLAGRLGLDFIDTDAVIEARTGASIGGLIARGEAVFRAVEEKVVHDAVSGCDGVVALGGGAVMSPDSRSLLSLRGTVVWLDADPAVVARRLSSSPRPALTALAPPEEARFLVEARRPLYASCATKRIDTSFLTPEEVCDGLEHVWRDLQDHDLR